MLVAVPVCCVGGKFPDMLCSADVEGSFELGVQLFSTDSKVFDCILLVPSNALSGQLLSANN